MYFLELQYVNLPNPASLVNLAVQRTNVVCSSAPEVTSQHWILLVMLEYDSSGLATMTLYVM